MVVFPFASTFSRTGFRMAITSQIKRVLIISEYMGEQHGPGGIVIKKYVENLSRYSDCTVDVVTSGFAVTSGQLFHIRRWVADYPRECLWEDRIASWLAGHPKAGSWGVRARKKVGSLISSGRRYDVIIAWSNPVSSLFACVSRSPSHNIPIVWRLDDPYPPCNYPKAPHWKPDLLHDEFEHSWLRDVLPQIQCLSTPTQELGEWMLHQFDVPDMNYVVWPHIGGNGEAVPHRSAVTSPTDWIEIAHFGRLSDNRDPCHLVEALLRLHQEGIRVRLHLFGSVHANWQDVVRRGEAQGIVVRHGEISLDESLARMQEYDALVLIEAKFERGLFLPSKFADYVWAQRPVLISTPPGGAVERHVGGTGFPGLLGYDVESTTACLRRFVADRQRGTPALRSYIPAYEKYSGLNVVKESLIALEEAVFDA